MTSETSDLLNETEITERYRDGSWRLSDNDNSSRDSAYRVNQPSHGCV
ncbi:MAG: hypothetical protein QOI59_902 [Gammaproteobacteria bacterium]|jgi:hypothetical protein|nr:hypothetical protein [Gammaproteobacteria bacterium]